MTTDPAPGTWVSRATTGEFLDGTTTEVVMAYRADDPWAVHFTFGALDAHATTWVFSRELLTEAFSFRTSFDRHDVQVVRRNATRMDLVLGGRTRSGRESHHTVGFETAALRAFLGLTLGLVSLGQESAFVDWTEAETVFDLPPGSLGAARP